MTRDKAYSLVRDFGIAFKESMEAIGKEIKPDETPLVLGIVAYETLDMKGRYAIIDEAMDIVLKDVVAYVKEYLNKEKV